MPLNIPMLLSLFQATNDYLKFKNRVVAELRLAKRKLLKASCLTLEIKEFRCYEAKVEESEKAGSHQELNPGHL